jgi:rod shape-determining protein MreD
VIVSVGSVTKVALLVLLTVVLQLAVVSQFLIFGSTADLSPLVVVAVGLLAGPVPGAIVGFSVGLLIDMSLVQTLGVTSLLLTGVGYMAGRYRELRDATVSLVPLVAGVVSTVAYLIAFSIVQFLLGVDSSISPLVIRDFLVATFLNVLIVLPVFAAVRALLRGSIVDVDGPRRRSQLTGLRIRAS